MKKILKIIKLPDIEFLKKFLINFQSVYPPIFAGIFIYVSIYYIIININLHLDLLISLLILIAFFSTILFSLDAIQRFRMYRAAYEYLKHKDAKLEELLYYEKIAWCTRESIKAACRQHSDEMYRKSISYYKKLGIRYYHIFPEGFFSLNSSIFDILYWKAAFFDIRGKNYFKEIGLYNQNISK